MAGRPCTSRRFESGALMIVVFLIVPLISLLLTAEPTIHRRRRLMSEPIVSTTGTRERGGRESRAV